MRQAVISDVHDWGSNAVPRSLPLPGDLDLQSSCNNPVEIICLEALIALLCSNRLTQTFFYDLISPGLLIKADGWKLNGRRVSREISLALCPTVTV